MVELDGTPNRGRLGANAVIGVSMATARLFAHAAGMPLWTWLRIPGEDPRLPVPHFNVPNGGAHVRTRLGFQEFMVAPLGAEDAGYPAGRDGVAIACDHQDLRYGIPPARFVARNRERQVQIP